MLTGSVSGIGFATADRFADAEEVAVHFTLLAPDDAKYITRADIRIDGGETAGLY